MNKNHQQILAEVKKIQDEAQARIDKVLKELNEAAVAPQPINETQELVFRLMELSSFNEFSGPSVVKDLKNHRNLWRGVIHDRLNSLIKLRDIEDGGLNVDTVYILPAQGHEDELEKLAKRWRADEVHWINAKAATGLLGTGGFVNEEKVILCCWWD